MNIIVFLIVGLVAGWLASVLIRGRGLGIIGDIVIGIAGAFLGGILFNLIVYQCPNLKLSLFPG